MNRLALARDIVRHHQLPDTLVDFEGLAYTDHGTEEVSGSLSPELLADSLHYAVWLSAEPAAEQTITLGSSKYRGLPHLPSGFEWPTGQYFAAQFNLTELHPFDIHDAFPATGMLYIFYNGAGDLAVIHHDGPTEELTVTPYPDAATLPGAEYYLAEFRDHPELADLTPEAIFYLNEGDVYDYSDVYKAIPEGLREEIETALDAPLTDGDGQRRIFGRPIFWQGEDDGAEEPQILLFSDEWGDASINIFSTAEDARNRNYSRCWIEGSTT